VSLAFDCIVSITLQEQWNKCYWFSCSFFSFAYAFSFGWSLKIFD